MSDEDDFAQYSSDFDGSEGEDGGGSVRSDPASRSRSRNHVRAKRRPARSGKKGTSASSTSRVRRRPVASATSRQYIAELEDKLHSKDTELRELKRECKALQDIQRRQEKALNKLEGHDSELPQRLRQRDEEIRALREQLRNAKEKLHAEKESQRKKDKHLQSIRDKSRQLDQLVQDKGLRERAELENELAAANQKIKEQEEEVAKLRRKADLEEKTRQRAEQQEMKMKATHKSKVAALQGQIEVLEASLAEKDRQVAGLNIRSHLNVGRASKAVSRAGTTPAPLATDLDTAAAASDAADERHTPSPTSPSHTGKHKTPEPKKQVASPQRPPRSVQQTVTPEAASDVDKQGSEGVGVLQRQATATISESMLGARREPPARGNQQQQQQQQQQEQEKHAVEEEEQEEEEVATEEEEEEGAANVSSTRTVTPAVDGQRKAAEEAEAKRLREEREKRDEEAKRAATEAARVQAEQKAQEAEEKQRRKKQEEEEERERRQEQQRREEEERGRKQREEEQQIADRHRREREEQERLQKEKEEEERRKAQQQQQQQQQQQMSEAERKKRELLAKLGKIDAKGSKAANSSSDDDVEENIPSLGAQQPQHQPQQQQPGRGRGAALPWLNKEPRQRAVRQPSDAVANMHRGLPARPDLLDDFRQKPGRQPARQDIDMSKPALARDAHAGGSGGASSGHKLDFLKSKPGNHPSSAHSNPDLGSSTNSRTGDGNAVDLLSGGSAGRQPRGLAQGRGSAPGLFPWEGKNPSAGKAGRTDHTAGAGDGPSSYSPTFGKNNSTSTNTEAASSLLGGNGGGGGGGKQLPWMNPSTRRRTTQPAAPVLASSDDDDGIESITL